MLVIRPDQVKAFEEAALARFALRVADEAALRKLAPSHDENSDFLLEIGRILKDGLSSGLTSELELARYTFLILRIERPTDKFNDWQGVREALANNDIEPSERLEKAYRAWRIAQRAFHTVISMTCLENLTHF